MDSATQPTHTNRLIDATSPYLLQHAHNPIDWYEWGDEAFVVAAREDKPIFLSIGYAACHWCHVMAHETFEDEQVAEFMNEHFVCIKVDREERPDVDEIYMHVTQVFQRGQGGWPMSVFLMPDRRPIYAGTYFPKETFVNLARRIAEMYTTQRDELIVQSTRVQEHLDEWAQVQATDDTLISAEVVDTAALLLARHIDTSRGGYQSDGNKFPPSMSMDLFLRVYQRTNNPTLLEAVTVTLDHMARGGIYDHIGGGICRYSTDPDWLVPHFEKMLYDQALVSAIYLDGFLVTGDRLYADTARDIFDYVFADLQSPEGSFYSTRDADSEGMEGAYYVWTVEQVRDVLGKEDAELFCKYYDVTDSGNWFESRGHAPSGPKNILHVSKPPEVFARLHGLEVDELRGRIEGWRKQMKAVRDKRVPPGLDDKILTGWNGLMIASLAKGARVLDEPRFAEAAAQAADGVLRHLMVDGRLLRTRRAGRSHLMAYLSDYAFLIEGLLNLYEATFDPRWLDAATELTDTAIRYYRDTEHGAFFFTAHDAEELIARTKNPRDGAIPSGNSVMAMDLLRLGKLLDRKDYIEHAESIFRAFREEVSGSPAAFERLLCAVDMYHHPVREIAIIGPLDSPATQSLVRTVFSRYIPNKVIAQADGDVGDSHAIALLADKKLRNGKPAAYVCENYTCKKPVTEPDDLAKLLDSKPSGGKVDTGG